MGSIGKREPVFLVVTGAWHPPACYEPLKTDLISLGYECIIPHMPSMGHGTNGVTWEADKAKIIEEATSYFNQGREVILVAHSYGGVPATVATEGQGTQERAARGLKGGFNSIIFVAAFAVPVRGWDLLTTFGGAWPDWQDTCESYTKNKLSTVNLKGSRLLYNDTSEEEATRVFSMLLPHSQDAFETGINFIASDIVIPKTYLICENDLVFPLSLQEALVKGTPAMQEERIAAGHSPFLGKSEELARKLIGISQKAGSAQAGHYPDPIACDGAVVAATGLIRILISVNPTLPHQADCLLKRHWYRQPPESASDDAVAQHQRQLDVSYYEPKLGA